MIHSPKPRTEWQFRTVHDCPGSHGRLMTTIGTLLQANPTWKSMALAMATLWAHEASWPSPPLQRLNAFRLSAILGVKINLAEAFLELNGVAWHEVQS